MPSGSGVLTRCVAVEEHVVTPELRTAWGQLGAQDRDDHIDYYLIDEIFDRLFETGDDRLRRMDEDGVDVQVLSLTTPGVHPLSRDRAVELARRSNDFIAETIRSEPDRFQGFAALPLQDPEAAAVELRRSVNELGLNGAMLFGRTHDRHLDHADFESVFTAAAELRVPLHLHAQIPSRKVREGYYAGLPGNFDMVLATVGVGWHYEAGLQFLRMVVAGVFDRHPDLKVILGHWGNMTLFYLDELDKIPRLARADMPPISEYVKRHVYVSPSGVLSGRYLGWAIEVIGVERMLFSLDSPFSRRNPGDARAFLDQAPVSGADRERIASGNWDALVADIRRSGPVPHLDTSDSE